MRDLAALRMGVRVDREGVPMRDYQTAIGVISATGKPNKNAVVSPRYYLADAAFLVGLEGGYKALLQQIEAALRSPHWPLALGRKSCVPTAPVGLPGGLREQPLMQALLSWPSLRKRGAKTDGLCRFVLEDDTEGSVRLDQPIGPFSERSFGPRYVKTLMESIDVPDTSTA